MTTIPVLGFAGYSGSGKTTLIEALLPRLAAQGLRVGVIKHDAHSFEPDYTGKDSQRFAAAGAAATAVIASDKSAMIDYRPRSFFEIAAQLRDVDLILVEGFKQLSLTQIGVCRAGIALPHSPSHYAAVVSDEALADAAVNFRSDAFVEIAAWIAENRSSFTQLTVPPLPELHPPVL